MLANKLQSGNDFGYKIRTAKETYMHRLLRSPCRDNHGHQTQLTISCPSVLVLIQTPSRDSPSRRRIRGAPWQPYPTDPNPCLPRLFFESAMIARTQLMKNLMRPENTCFVTFLSPVSQ